MTVNNIYKPTAYWDQTEFEAFKATLTPERIAEDEKLMQEIAKLTAYSPLLAEALDWAEQRGMKFFVDHTAVNVRGYYSAGTGILCISKKIAENPVDAVSTLVHEIRHAWQECNGLWSDGSQGFSNLYITQSLVEADAKAIGLRAGEQCRAALLAKEGKPVPAELQASLADESADLAQKFLERFSTASWTAFYGDSTSKRFGQAYKLFPIDETKPDKGLPARNLEFSPKAAKPSIGKISIRNIEDIMPLGVNFSGTKNYLAALQPDVLPKIILNPSLADTFWGAANDEQKKLIKDVRKEYLKRKLGAERIDGKLVATKHAKRHPWP